MTRVLIVRGHQVTPWELRPWQELPVRFEVSYLLTSSNRFALPEGLHGVHARSLRDLLPPGPVGEIGSQLLGDRYLSGEDAFAQADIVHAAELSSWFAAEAAVRKRKHGFKLVQTVWETLPLLVSYRNGRIRRTGKRAARGYRDLVLADTDLFLAATERAALALELEGVPRERIVVCAPGIDLERFAPATAGETVEQAPGARAPAGEVAQGQAASLGDASPGGAEPRWEHKGVHTIVSPGRLVWEKGHQDVLRALALLHRGIVRPPAGEVVRPRLLIVGSGPEEARLRAHATDLGLSDHVEIRGVPYEQMPAVFANASAMVLASQAVALAALHPFDIPRAFWEEQFGMVLAEAMAAGLAIVTTTSGAIPEVVDGAPVDLVAPGDWPEIARALARGPLSRPPGARVEYPQKLVTSYSTAAAAERLAAAYDRLIAN